jgi:MFS family permease
LSISQALLVAPIATWTVRKYGTRLCLHLGVFLQTLSLIGASFAHHKYQILLSQGVCFGWGLGFLFVASVGIIAQWFTTKRSLANAIAAAGSGFGGLIYSLATQSLIDTLGLPWCFRILAILSCVVNLICSNLLRDRNQAVGARHQAFRFQLFQRPEFVLLLGWSILSMLGYVSLIFSLPNYAASIGLSTRQGSIIGALMNLGQMIGRPMIGLISDRYGRLNIAVGLSFLCGLFCFAFWIPAANMALLSFFAIAGGGLSGTFWATIAPIAAEVVGLRDLPSALSITWVMLVPPTTVSEPISLELRKEGRSRTYLDAQVFVAMMYLGAALCLWIVRGWKILQLTEREIQSSEGTNDVKDPSDIIELAQSPRIRWTFKLLARKMWAKKIV